MKIKIFILAYNENTLDLAKEKYSCYDWAQPILLKNATEKNPYFENIFYLQFQENLEYNNILNVDDCDCIGTLSYKAFKKINLRKLDLFLRNLLSQIYVKYEFVHFFSFENKTVAKSHMNGGQNFKNMWIDCCEKDIGCMQTTKVGFCNYWMAQKKYFFEFCDFLKQFIKKCEAHPNACMNGKYFGGKLSDSKLQKLCGYPYYPILPFLLERCTVGYFEKQGFIKTCHLNNILCMNDKNLLKKLHENFLNISDDVFSFEFCFEKPTHPKNYSYERNEKLDFLKDNKKQEYIQKKLILYIFHKMDENVKYFLENGLYQDENTDFLIIINQTYTENSCKERIPSILKKDIEFYFLNKYPNVSILERENKSFDFGGWYEGLTKEKLWKKYNYFLFLNSSVIGPFSKEQKWAESFFQDLYFKNRKIALSGTTINFQHNLHVQSMCFAIKYGFLRYLLNSNQIFLKEIKTKDEAIHSELNLSKICLNFDYGIQTKIKYYLNQTKSGIFKNTIFKEKKSDNINKSPESILKYMNHPTEFVFVKNKFYNNKDINVLDKEFTNELNILFKKN